MYGMLLPKHKPAVRSTREMIVMSANVRLPHSTHQLPSGIRFDMHGLKSKCYPLQLVALASTWIHDQYTSKVRFSNEDIPGDARTHPAVQL